MKLLGDGCDCGYGAHPLASVRDAGGGSSKLPPAGHRVPRPAGFFMQISAQPTPFESFHNRAAFDGKHISDIFYKKR